MQNLYTEGRNLESSFVHLQETDRDIDDFVIIPPEAVPNDQQVASPEQDLVVSTGENQAASTEQDLAASTENPAASAEQAPTASVKERKAVYASASIETLPPTAPTTTLGSFWSLYFVIGRVMTLLFDHIQRALTVPVAIFLAYL